MPSIEPYSVFSSIPLIIFDYFCLKEIASIVLNLLSRLSRSYFLPGQGKKSKHSRSYGITF